MRPDDGPRPASRNRGVPIARVLRLLVAVVLTAYVLWHADPGAVLRAAADASPWWLALAVGLVLIDRSLMAARWIDLLAALTPGSRPPFAVVVRIFFVSSFVSNFVPSVAADMYRAYALARCDVRLAESTASVLMDRLLGVLSMVLVGAAALPFAGDAAVRDGLATGLALTFGACALAGAVVFSGRVAQLAQRAVGVLGASRLDRIAIAMTDAVRRYASHRVELVRVLLLSVLVQAIRVTQAWCLFRALGADVTLLTCFVLVPLILVVMQLPITVNGLGTTQWAFAALFVPAGVPEARAFAVSVLFLALGIIGSLPGGVLYATEAGAVPHRPPA
jgi:uncharacterized membrane protein YbhN (UPF0104 family)